MAEGSRIVFTRNFVHSKLSGYWRKMGFYPNISLESILNEIFTDKHFKNNQFVFYPKNHSQATALSTRQSTVNAYNAGPIKN